MLYEHDHEWPRPITHPHDLLAGRFVTTAMHDVHVRVAPVEIEACLDVADGKRHVRESMVDAHGEQQRTRSAGSPRRRGLAVRRCKGGACGGDDGIVEAQRARKAVVHSLSP
jgi:hypothetical protein